MSEPPQPGVWCEVCQPPVLMSTEEIIDHFRRLHPAEYGDGPERWPDGEPVVVVEPDPEDFTSRGWTIVPPPPGPTREVVELLANRVADEGKPVRAGGWIALPEELWAMYEQMWTATQPEGVPIRLRSGDACVYVLRDPEYRR